MPKIKIACKKDIAVRHAFYALSLALMTSPALAQNTPAGAYITPVIAGNSASRPIFFEQKLPAQTVLVIVMPDKELPDIGLDKATATTIEKAIASAKFDGAQGSSLSLRGIGGYPHIYLAGYGGEENLTLRLQSVAGHIAQDLRKEDYPIAIAGNFSAQDAAALALGYQLGQYRFDRYKTQGHTPPPVQKLSIITTDPAAAEAAWNMRGRALAEAVSFSRDLANEPANILYPEAFVSRVRAAFDGLDNISIEVLDEAAMRKLGMGAIIGVGQASRRPPQLMLVHYKGSKDAPLAIVGKGITFDSGGISLKPGLGMWEMKSDMSGAASAMAALLALAKSKAPVNMVAVAALAENMPGGNAQRPGDVVRTMRGKTIEILNTDAEGRLVLADASEYVLAKYKPAAVITIATLTGAISQALGDEYAGLFSRDDRLADQLKKAGIASGEDIWRMPLHKNHQEDMKSDIADIKNVVEGGKPGASLGATFIGYFMDPKIPWAHLDIAGVNWAEKSDALTPKGASGWGVRLLENFARQWQP